MANDVKPLIGNPFVDTSSITDPLKEFNKKLSVELAVQQKQAEMNAMRLREERMRLLRAGQDRSLGELTGDIGLGLGKAVLHAGEFGYNMLDLASWAVPGETTLDDVVGLSDNFRESKRILNDQRSGVLKAQEEQFRADMAAYRAQQPELGEDASVWDKVKAVGAESIEAVKQAFSNGAYLTDMALESIDSVLGASAAGKAAANVALKNTSNKLIKKHMKGEIDDAALAAAKEKTKNRIANTAAGKKLQQTAATRGAIGFTGLTEGSSNAVDAHRLIMDADVEELKKNSPRFNELLKKYNGDVEKAKKELADEAYAQTFIKAGLVAMGASKITGAGKFEGNLFNNKVNSSLNEKLHKLIGGSIAATTANTATKAVTAAGKEFFEEYIQSGYGQYALNLVESEFINNNKNKLERVGEAAGQGASAGFVTGGPMSLASSLVTADSSIIAGAAKDIKKIIDRRNQGYDKTTRALVDAGKTNELMNPDSEYYNPIEFAKVMQFEAEEARKSNNPMEYAAKITNAYAASLQAAKYAQNEVKKAKESGDAKAIKAAEDKNAVAAEMVEATKNFRKKQQQTAQKQNAELADQLLKEDISEEQKSQVKSVLLNNMQMGDRMENEIPVTEATAQVMLGSGQLTEEETTTVEEYIDEVKTMQQVHDDVMKGSGKWRGIATYESSIAKSLDIDDVDVSKDRTIFELQQLIKFARGQKEKLYLLMNLSDELITKHEKGEKLTDAEADLIKRYEANSVTYTGSERLRDTVQMEAAKLEEAAETLVSRYIGKHGSEGVNLGDNILDTTFDRKTKNQDNIADLTEAESFNDTASSEKRVAPNGVVVNDPDTETKLQELLDWHWENVRKERGTKGTGTGLNTTVAEYRQFIKQLTQASDLVKAGKKVNQFLAAKIAHWHEVMTTQGLNPDTVAEFPSFKQWGVLFEEAGMKGGKTATNDFSLNLNLEGTQEATQPTETAETASGAAPETEFDGENATLDDLVSEQTSDTENALDEDGFGTFKNERAEISAFINTNDEYEVTVSTADSSSNTGYRLKLNPTFDTKEEAEAFYQKMVNKFSVETSQDREATVSVDGQNVDRDGNTTDEADTNTETEGQAEPETAGETQEAAQTEAVPETSTRTNNPKYPALAAIVDKYNVSDKDKDGRYAKLVERVDALLEKAKDIPENAQKRLNKFISEVKKVGDITKYEKQVADYIEKNKKQSKPPKKSVKQPGETASEKDLSLFLDAVSEIETKEQLDALNKAAGTQLTLNQVDTIVNDAMQLSTEQFNMKYGNKPDVVNKVAAYQEQQENLPDTDEATYEDNVEPEIKVEPEVDNNLRSPRQVETERQRLKIEIKNRVNLLNNKNAMARKAEQAGISVEEMTSLTKENMERAKARLKELDNEKTREPQTDNITFTDTTDVADAIILEDTTENTEEARVIDDAPTLGEKLTPEEQILEDAIEGIVQEQQEVDDESHIVNSVETYLQALKNALKKRHTPSKLEEAIKRNPLVQAVLPEFRKLLKDSKSSFKKAKDLLWGVVDYTTQSLKNNKSLLGQIREQNLVKSNKGFNPIVDLFKIFTPKGNAPLSQINNVLDELNKIVDGEPSILVTEGILNPAHVAALENNPVLGEFISTIFDEVLKAIPIPSKQSINRLENVNWIEYFYRTPNEGEKITADNKLDFINQNLVLAIALHSLNWLHFNSGELYNGTPGSINKVLGRENNAYVSDVHYEFLGKMGMPLTAAIHDAGRMIVRELGAVPDFDKASITDISQLESSLGTLGMIALEKSNLVNFKGMSLDTFEYFKEGGYFVNEIAEIEANFNPKKDKSIIFVRPKTVQTLHNSETAEPTKITTNIPAEDTFFLDPNLIEFRNAVKESKEAAGQHLIDALVAESAATVRDVHWEKGQGHIPSKTRKTGQMLAEIFKEAMRISNDAPQTTNQGLKALRRAMPNANYLVRIMGAMTPEQIEELEDNPNIRQVELISAQGKQFQTSLSIEKLDTLYKEQEDLANTEQGQDPFDKYFYLNQLVYSNVRIGTLQNTINKVTDKVHRAHIDNADSYYDVDPSNLGGATEYYYSVALAMSFGLDRETAGTALMPEIEKKINSKDKKTGGYPAKRALKILRDFYKGKKLPKDFEDTLVAAVDYLGEDAYSLQGLVDYAQYLNAKEAGKKYSTALYAEFDGITNGFAHSIFQFAPSNIADAPIGSPQEFERIDQVNKLLEYAERVGVMSDTKEYFGDSQQAGVLDNYQNLAQEWDAVASLLIKLYDNPPEEGDNRAIMRIRELDAIHKINEEGFFDASIPDSPYFTKQKETAVALIRQLIPEISRQMAKDPFMISNYLAGRPKVIAVFALNTMEDYFNKSIAEIMHYTALAKEANDKNNQEKADRLYAEADKLSIVLEQQLEALHVVSKLLSEYDVMEKQKNKNEKFGNPPYKGIVPLTEETFLAEDSKYRYRPLLNSPEDLFKFKGSKEVNNGFQEIIKTIYGQALASSLNTTLGPFAKEREKGQYMIELLDEAFRREYATREKAILNSKDRVSNRRSLTIKERNQILEDLKDLMPMFPHFLMQGQDVNEYGLRIYTPTNTASFVEDEDGNVTYRKIQTKLKDTTLPLQEQSQTAINIRVAFPRMYAQEGQDTMVYKNLETNISTTLQEPTYKDISVKGTLMQNINAEATLQAILTVLARRKLNIKAVHVNGYDAVKTNAADAQALGPLINQIFAMLMYKQSFMKDIADRFNHTYAIPEFGKLIDTMIEERALAISQRTSLTYEEAYDQVSGQIFGFELDAQASENLKNEIIEQHITNWNQFDAPGGHFPNNIQDIEALADEVLALEAELQQQKEERITAAAEQRAAEKVNKKINAVLHFLHNILNNPDRYKENRMGMDFTQEFPQILSVITYLSTKVDRAKLAKAEDINLELFKILKDKFSARYKTAEEGQESIFMQSIKNIIESGTIQSMSNAMLGNDKDGSIDPKNFNALFTYETTGENLNKIYDMLNSLYDKPSEHEISEKHDKHLRSIIGKIGTKIINAFNIKVAEDGSKNRGSYWHYTKDVYLTMRKQSPVTKRNPQMSSREVLAHELGHKVMYVAINEDSYAKRELKRLHDWLKKNTAHMKETMFIPPDVTVESVGQAMYDQWKEWSAGNWEYVFNTPTQTLKETNPITKETYEIEYDAGLQELGAFMMTNEGFRESLFNLKESVPRYWKFKKGDSWIESVINFVEYIIDTVHALIRGARPDRMDHYLMGLFHELGAIEQEHKTKVMRALQRADLVYNKIASAVHTGIIAPATTLLGKVMQKSKEPITRFAGVVLENPDEAIVGMKRMLDDHMRPYKTNKKDVDGFVPYLFRELLGVTDSNFYAAFLNRKSTSTVDIERRNESTAYSEAVREAFKHEDNKNLTKEQKRVLGFMLWADTQFLLDNSQENKLGNYNLQDIYDLYTDSNKLNSRIKAVEAAIASEFSNLQNYYIRMGRNLGYFMQKGQSLEGDVDLNAEVIARADYPGLRELVTGDLKRAEALIDELASLTSIQYLDQNKKNDIAAIFEKEMSVDTSNNGISFMLKTHAVLVEAAKTKLFEGETYKMMKGYTREVLDGSVDIKVVNAAAGKILIKQGYTLIGSVSHDKVMKDSPIGNKSAGMYVRKNYTNGVYEGKALSFTGERTKGARGINIIFNAGFGLDAGNTTAKTIHHVRKQKWEIRRDIAQNKSAPAFQENVLIPVYEETAEGTLRIKDYRYIMATDTKRDVLSQDTAFDRVIGYTAGNIQDKVRTREINREIMETLRDIYTESAPEEESEFKYISPTSTDKKMREMWDMLPEETKKYAYKIFGERRIPIKGTEFTTIFGQRRLTTANLKQIDDSRAEGLEWLKIKINNMLEKMLNNYVGHMLEGGTRELIRLVKDAILIKIGTVFAWNMLSNITLLRMKGVPFHEIFKNLWAAFRDGVRYKRIEKKMRKAELNYRMTKDPKDKARVKKLRAKLAENKVHELTMAYTFQNLVEDLDLERNDFDYGGSFEELIRKNKMVGAAMDAIPEFAKTTAKVIFMAHETQLYQFMNEATQLSDFAARYVLHEYNTKTKKMDPETSHREIMDTFIDYDLPTHPVIQAANDLGLVMFTKFAMRIQKVIIKMLRENTANVFMFMGLGALLDWMGLGQPPNIVTDEFAKPLTMDWGAMDSMWNIINPMPVQIIRDVAS